MAGATAVTAAGVTASQATTITVNLLNNYISAHGGNHLNADLTGDGHPDLTIAGAFAGFSTRTIGTFTTFTNARAAAVLNGVQAYAFKYGDGGPIGETLGSKMRTGRYCSGTPNCGDTLTGSIPIFFKDLHINGGAPTKGSLEVTVGTVTGGTGVQLDSFTYNDPPSHAAVPDQGSSLALMTMGASGILALRRWRAVRGRS
jgi:hypothetical protein